MIGFHQAHIHSKKERILDMAWVGNSILQRVVPWCDLCCGERKLGYSCMRNAVNYCVVINTEAQYRVRKEAQYFRVWNLRARGYNLPRGR